MNNPTDSTIESVENQTPIKRGPRDRFYFCAAVRGKSVVYEAVKANSSEEAKAIFEQNHDIKATVCDDGAGLRGGGNGFYVPLVGFRDFTNFFLLQDELESERRRRRSRSRDRRRRSRSRDRRRSRSRSGGRRSRDDRVSSGRVKEEHGEGGGEEREGRY